MSHPVRKLIIIIIVSIQISWAISLSKPKEAAAKKLVGDIINCEFASAIVYADSLIKVDSEEPLYFLLRLCAIGLRDLDYDRVIDSVVFFDAYETTLKKIAVYQGIHGQDSYSLTLKGLAYGTHSSFYLLHKKYFSALGTGLEAMRMFTEAKKLDSTNYDVDLLLGFYNYAKGELKKKLWMVLFWYPGNRKEGIKSLENCSRLGSFTAEGAKMILVDIYSRELHYKKAQKLSDLLMQVYPKSRFLLWSKARFYEGQKEPLAAARMYGLLSDSYEKEKYGDYNALVTRLMQIKLLEKNDKKIEAAQLAREALKMGFCKRTKRNGKVCREIERILKD